MKKYQLPYILSIFLLFFNCAGSEVMPPDDAVGHVREAEKGLLFTPESRIDMSSYVLR